MSSLERFSEYRARVRFREVSLYMDALSNSVEPPHNKHFLSRSNKAVCYGDVSAIGEFVIRGSTVDLEAKPENFSDNVTE
jgi:hypothetical protein